MDLLHFGKLNELVHMKNKVLALILFACFLFSCENVSKKTSTSVKTSAKTTNVKHAEHITLSLEQANKLAALPMECVQKEYPNRLGQTLGSKEDLHEPKKLHPAFYGCFDWHSAVHAHWSVVRLLKTHPNLAEADQLRRMLKENMSAENIAREMAYFDDKNNRNFERTYGWGWLLKLAEELHTWNDPLARELEENLSPLAQLLAKKLVEYLPKLQYPVRVGTHTNTAFGLAFAWDYAATVQDKELMEAISERALHFYKTDANCPLTWEPSGADFLSPCFEELDLMRRIMDETAFFLWMDSFMPELSLDDFELEVALVGDREDGQLVHLDGLNFSRAWVLYGLASQYPGRYGHVLPLAAKHLQQAFPNLFGDSYEGGHWLGSFAIYAMGEQE